MAGALTLAAAAGFAFSSALETVGVVKTLIEALAVLVVAPALPTAGGALVAKALGMGWKRAVPTSLAALVAGLCVSTLLEISLTATLGITPSYWAPTSNLVALMVVASAARFGDTPTGLKELAAPAVVGVVLLPITLLSDQYVVLIGTTVLAWVLLPALVAAGQP